MADLLSSGLEFELVPSSNEQIAAVDVILAEL
jgi:hypothetical protein